MRDELGLDVMPSNPYTTRLIAESKKKTDRVDARVLADMLRGDYISGCHVPSREVMGYRDLVRHRHRMVRLRTGLKNSIHGILLQGSVTIGGTPFSSQWICKALALDDYRIRSYLSLIESLNDQIAGADTRIREAVGKYKDAQLVQTVPGIGAYTALTVASEIDGVDRFLHSGRLCAYFGLVPSVRSSGDVVNYGPITRQGNSMVRHLLTEAVHTHVRFAPKSDITVFYKRIAKKRGNGRAAVAAAAKILKCVFWMLRDRRAFVTNYGQEISCDEFIGG